jgi:hypothetical protein
MKKGKPNGFIIVFFFLFGLPLTRILFGGNIASLNLIQLVLGLMGVGAVIVSIVESVRYLRYQDEPKENNDSIQGS